MFYLFHLGHLTVLLFMGALWMALHKKLGMDAEELLKDKPTAIHINFGGSLVSWTGFAAPR